MDIVTVQILDSSSYSENFMEIELKILKLWDFTALFLKLEYYAVFGWFIQIQSRRYWIQRDITVLVGQMSARTLTDGSWRWCRYRMGNPLVWLGPVGICPTRVWELFVLLLHDLIHEVALQQPIHTYTISEWRETFTEAWTKPSIMQLQQS